MSAGYGMKVAQSLQYYGAWAISSHLKDRDWDTAEQALMLRQMSEKKRYREGEIQRRLITILDVISVR